MQIRLCVFLRFPAVNACFPPMKSVFPDVKHRFHVEDWFMFLRVLVFGAIFKDEIFYKVQGLHPMDSSLMNGPLPTPQYPQQAIQVFVLTFAFVLV